MKTITDLLIRIRDTNGDSLSEEELRKVLSREEGDLAELFFPADKNLWEASALVLGQIGFPRLNRFIPSCLEWYQDLNWPGIGTITELLKQADPSLVLKHSEESTRIAVADQDEQWLGGLKHLMAKLNLNPARFHDPALAQALIRSDFY
jgi:hypothetical protein